MHEPHRILIVGDGVDLVEELAGDLTGAGFVVRWVASVEEGLAVVSSEAPDVVLLDLAMPVLETVRAGLALGGTASAGPLPILVVGHERDPSDKILALERGADDYVSRPYDPRELFARIRALVRRCALARKARRLSVGRIELDAERYRASVGGREVTLTSKEFGLLQALMEADGRVARREDLLENVWSYGSAAEIESRTLDVHVNRLRQKLGAEGRRIVTVRNVGYRMDVVDVAEGR